MQTKEIEKSKIQILIEIIKYVPKSIVSKNIIRKITGNISIIAIDNGEALTEKISPFDNFIQIIEGTAEIFIDDQPYILKTGQGIIIPAHTSNVVKANEKLKLISTVIKSGYEGNLI